MCKHSNILNEANCSFCVGLPDVTKIEWYISKQELLVNTLAERQSCLNAIDEETGASKSQTERLARLDGVIEGLVRDGIEIDDVLIDEEEESEDA